MRSEARFGGVLRGGRFRRERDAHWTVRNGALHFDGFKGGHSLATKEDYERKIGIIMSNSSQKRRKECQAMTNAALRGKPDAGNSHVRFDEGEVASAATPRRGSILRSMRELCIIAYLVAAGASLPAATAPQSVASSGVNLMSATSVAKAETPTSLSSVYRSSMLSNFIDLVTDKLGFILTIY